MEKSINTLRVLGVDMIQEANSGHPGIVLGAAPMLYTLYKNHMNVNVKNDKWFNRDRFIMAAGHGSALLYSLLHLSGFGLSIEDLKQFRQLGSLTPGHPEYNHTLGIDATSGPLGQGIAMGVGMAIAEHHLAAKFNKPNLEVVDHYTFVLCGDGDLQEGVTQEAISLAGHLKLNKLVVLYDSNDIQLDGSVNMTNTENIKEKYEAMNWNYILVKDGEDTLSINEAIKKSKNNANKPTIIEIKTKIGYKSHLEGDSASHGAPLGVEGVKTLKENLLHSDKSFFVEDDVYADFKENIIDRGLEAFNKWTNLLEEYKENYKEDYNELIKIINNESIDLDFNDFAIGTNEATRVTSGNLINQISEKVTSFIGGSADLTKSTKVKGLNGDYSKENPLGRNINYGVREHAMGAIVNGLVLHNLKGFSGGFFVFSDYMKPAIRMAALMGIPSLFVFTHDSVAVGEDGPTHQPIEQLTGLRAIPNLNVIRPGNANEVKEAYKFALNSKDTPTVIVLSRQNIETINEVNNFEKGAYVAKKETKGLTTTLIACGSELQLALKVAKEREDIRVVSMPSINIFDKQSKEYQKEILGDKSIVAIEMAYAVEYYKYANNVINIDKFGLSGPGNKVIDEMGFNMENILSTIKL